MGALRINSHLCDLWAVLVGLCDGVVSLCLGSCDGFRRNLCAISVPQWLCGSPGTRLRLPPADETGKGTELTVRTLDSLSPLNELFFDLVETALRLIETV